MGTIPVLFEYAFIHVSGAALPVVSGPRFLVCSHLAPYLQASRQAHLATPAGGWAPPVLLHRALPSLLLAMDSGFS